MPTLLETELQVNNNAHTGNTQHIMLSNGSTIVHPVERIIRQTMHKIRKQNVK